MKRIICILIALVAFGTSSFAQNSKAAKSPAPAKKVAPAPAKKATDAKPAVKTKKDGTPDMRYKANKDAAKPASGPMKKDGTPDKRYKTNKTSATKTPAPKAK